MENILAQEDIRALKEYNEQLKKELQPFCIDMESMPLELNQQLDEYIEIQLRTGLSQMSEITLQEFYLIKRKQQIDNKIYVAKLKSEVDDLKNQIEKETHECALLEKFVNKHSNEKDDSKLTISLLEKELEKLQIRQQKFKDPENFNIDELIKKLEILKHRQLEHKK